MKEKIEEIWKRVLELEEIPEDENFFDLGGTSLLTYKMCMLAKEEYGINIKPIDVMENPTLRQLSASLAGERGSYRDSTNITRRRR
ncbi:acyl carrier protein [Lachnospiraceae bacterium ZAX-1]